MSDARLPVNFAPDFEPVLAQLTAEERSYRGDIPIVDYGRCFVTQSGVGLKRLRLIPETVFDGPRDKHTRHLRRYARYKFATTRRERRREPDLLLLHNHWSSGYYHWLAEVLLKIQFIDPRAHSVVLPSSYPDFAAESLALFDWHGIVPIPAARSLVADRLTVIANPTSGYFNSVHLEWLRDALLLRCEANDAPSVRIYITRRSAARRRVENEDEVMAVLGPLGFVAVDTADLSFCEQVRLFARSEALIALHGAGLANMLFMPRNAGVLELYRDLTSEAPAMNPCYVRLAAALGLRYHYQFCAHGTAEEPWADNRDVIVDIERLSRNVELLLGGNTP